MSDLEPVELNKHTGINRFKSVWDKNPSGMGVVRSQLLRLLKSTDLVGWSTFEESGRLDRKAFSRFACGSTQVFNQRMYKEAENSAVSLFLDCSGSMSGERMRTTQEVAIQLVKVLDKADVSYAVTGFDSWHETEVKYVDGVEFTPEDVRLYPFKQWGESLQKSIPKLGMIHKVARAGNPDYSAVMVGLDDLRKRPERKKIMFFMTDSGSVNYAHMERIDSVAERFGITLIAIGIETREVLGLYKHAVSINDLEDMASSTFSLMLKAIK